MPQPYLGDPRRAHRLNAARRAAGYVSVRAAATKFGWALATYRAHEGATRAMPEDQANRYADAFRVDRDWLWRGRGKGPALDRVRVAKYKARAEHAAIRQRDDPAEWGYFRLRVARRLAGFWSLKDAAEFIDMPPTTLAAHESGQNRISTRMAQIYGAAFGVHPAWLRLGTEPSGYPPRLDATLDSLATMHNEPESVARSEFPPGPPRSSSSFSLPAQPQGGGIGKIRPSTGDTVPEIAPEQLLRALTADGVDVWSVHAERTWWFPERFLADTMSCDPTDAVVIVANVSSPTSRPGDRVIVDTSANKALSGGTYAMIDSRGRISTGHPPSAGHRIIGRACGIIGGLH
jgi:Helix-turn-helix